MAVKYLSGNRLWGTNAERLALTVEEMVGVEWDTGNLNNMELPSTPEWTTADGISDASPLVGTVLKKDGGATDAWDADARSVGTYLGGSGTVLISVVPSYVASGSIGNTATYASTFKLASGDFDASTEDRSDILGWYANGSTAIFYYGTQVSAVTTYGNSPLTKLKTVLETNGQTSFWYSNGSGLGDTYTHGYTDTTDRTDEVYKVWGIIARENGETVSIIGGQPISLNLPNGSVFITSDTNVHYMWNSSAETWHEVA